MGVRLFSGVLFVDKSVKRDHLCSQKGPTPEMPMERGHYRKSRKEHIANREQIVYGLVMLDSGLRRPIFRMSEGRIPP
jgi:hypothetical protein